MLVRYSERRRYIRVPASGHVYWESGARRGSGELVDVSPGGAALRLPLRRAMQLGTLVDVEVAVAPDVRWLLARGAVVVRRLPDDDGACEVGILFDRDEQASGAVARSDPLRLVRDARDGPEPPYAAQRGAGRYSAPVNSETWDRRCAATYSARPRAI